MAEMPFLDILQQDQNTFTWNFAPKFERRPDIRARHVFDFLQAAQLRT
jgi:hypothetical protein